MAALDHTGPPLSAGQGRALGAPRRAIRAVVFDFFGTLVRHTPEDAERPELEPATGTFMTRYLKRLAALGYEHVDRVVIERHVLRWNATLEHREHSVSEEAFERYLIDAYSLLVRDLGVDLEKETDALAAFLAVDRSPVVAYGDVVPCLSRLAVANLRLVVCSNWGWGLEPYIEQAGTSPYLDAAVTSARVGVKKPHPDIYRAALGAVGVAPDQAVFVGDSWEADVAGPLETGLAHAVHLDRARLRAGRMHEAASSIATLTDLPGLVERLQRQPFGSDH